MSAGENGAFGLTQLLSSTTLLF